MLEDTARESVELLGIEVVGFDAELVHLTATLRPAPKRLGLSLGDRSCLAMGLVRHHTVVTAERTWSQLSFGGNIDVIG